MVVPQLPKLVAWVRFPSPAPERKDFLWEVLSCVSEAIGRLRPPVLQMPGGSKPRLAPQALPAAKHSYGAKAPRPEGRSGGSVPAYPFHNPYFKISVLTVLCTSEWTALHSKSPAVWPGFFHTAPLFLLFPTKFCWRKLPRVPRGPWPGEISVLTLLCKPEP